MRIAVLMTAFNRKNATLRCLRALSMQELDATVAHAVYLVDDGSTDGTGVAVNEAFPDARVIQGTGDLYWCGGMRLAWQHALRDGPDAYLWLNDDTHMLPGALMKLVHTAFERSGPRGEPRIAVGSCRDPKRHTLTYGGLRQRGRHPSWTELIPPRPETTVACDTFNGNIVLVPASVVDRIGLMRRFRHGMGDVDYGYTARRNGIPRLVAPGYLAECSRNAEEGRLYDPGVGRWKRLREAWTDPKGLPPRSWARFLRAHGGAFWPIWWLYPYVRIITGSKQRGPGRRR